MGYGRPRHDLSRRAARAGFEEGKLHPAKHALPRREKSQGGARSAPQGKSVRSGMIMSKQRYPACEAWQVARPLAFALERVCERVEIAGSLRRKKAEVGDIEILFIPKIGDAGTDLFARTP